MIGPYKYPMPVFWVGMFSIGVLLGFIWLGGIQPYGVIVAGLIGFFGGTVSAMILLRMQ